MLKLDSYQQIPAIPLHLGSSTLKVLHGVLPDDTIRAGFQSLGELVNALIQFSLTEHIILHRSEIVFDEGFFTGCQELIREVEEKYSNWGVCSATGVRWDGQRAYKFIRRIPDNPEASLCLRPVLMIGSEVLLLNIKRLRSQGCALPNQSLEWYEIGPLLALESLRTTSCVLADRRLFAVDAGEAPEYDDCRGLEKHCRDHFLNHLITVPGEVLEIEEASFETYLALPPVPHERQDLLRSFDSALEEARCARPLTLAIVCRSQLNRPHLLERALLSFAAARIEAPEWLSLVVMLASDRDAKVLRKEVEALRSQFPGLPILELHVASRTPATSRIDHILCAIDQAKADYIWFVDDDDFVMPGALPALARTLPVDAPMIVVGESRVYDEVWEDGALVEANSLPGFVGNQIFKNFQGENFVPICGMIIPTALAKDRMRGVCATGNYLEDYFLLMRLLTSARVEVECLPIPVSGISLRGSENTVREVNRDLWSLSYAQFVGEILRAEDSCNPLLWQLVEAYRPRPN